MELAETQEIIECLPSGRTPFPYYKDRYALLLLAMVIGEGCPKRDLEGTPFARLLSKPLVRDVLAASGDGSLNPLALEQAWPKQYETYLLTLGTWERGNRYFGQTSRPGANLVLQLNFSSRHNDEFRRLFDCDDLTYFQRALHPVAKPPYCTMAWSRLDVDLDRGVALIEEIQNDWIRDALRERRRAAMWECNRTAPATLEYARRTRMYVDRALRVHEALWEEAMLAATLYFLRCELGVRTVFYHTPTSGKLLKRIGGTPPPRSLYTQLPKKFCFTPTRSMPPFLCARPKNTQARRRRDAMRFLRLDL